MLAIRLFDEPTKRAAYEQQTKKAKAVGVSNCALCAHGDNANKTRIYAQKEMDADHVDSVVEGWLNRPHQLRDALCHAQPLQGQPVDPPLHASVRGTNTGRPSDPHPLLGLPSLGTQSPSFRYLTSVPAFLRSRYTLSRARPHARQTQAPQLLSSPPPHL